MLDGIRGQCTGLWSWRTSMARSSAPVMELDAHIAVCV